MSVQAHARAAGLLSDEHFTVDGTQLEAWASLKSFRCVDAAESDPPEDPGNPTVNFHGERIVASASPGSTVDGGMMKTVGGLRKLRHRGIALVDWQLTFAATAFTGGEVSLIAGRGCRWPPRRDRVVGGGAR